MKKYNHGGLSKVAHDFSINLNPLGIIESAKRIIKVTSNNELMYMSYPNPYPYEVETSLSICQNIRKEKISIGIGASEIIDRLVRVINPQSGLVLSPCFSEYERCLRVYNKNVVYHNLSSVYDFCVDETILTSIDKLNKGDILFICTPNNPNGLVVPFDILIKCIKKCEKKSIFLVLDISFLDFANSYKIELTEDISGENNTYYNCSLNKIITNSKYLFLLNTFTKVFSIPSLRIGYGFSNNKELIAKLNTFFIPWGVSTLSQLVANSICNDKSYNKWINNTKDEVSKLRKFLVLKLSKLPIIIYKSDCNFILFQDINHHDLQSKLAEYDIAIRDCSNYHTLDDTYYRIAVKSYNENEYLIDVLYKIYGVDCG